MDEAQAIAARPRYKREILPELYAAWDEHWAIVKIAAEYHALDCRPFLIAGDHIERIGAFELPENVNEALKQSAERVGRLKHELYTAPH